MSAPLQQNDPKRQNDARDNAIYQNKLFTVGPHAKIDILSDESYIAVRRQELVDSGAFPTFIDLLENGCLQDLFNAISGASQQFTNPNDLFFLLNATDARVTEVNHTHSKGSYPHAHIVSGKTKTDIGPHTYAPAAKDSFEDAFANRASLFPSRPGTNFTVFEVPDEYAESSDHLMVVSGGFNSFEDFVQNATDEDYAELTQTLLRELRPLVAQGGARVIVDENFRKPGVFAIRIQAGDQQHQWFKKASPKPVA